MSDEVKTRVPEYSKGIIYKLCCKDPEISEIYIGSTTNFIQRKKNHKNCCNNESSKAYNRYVYQVIRDKGGFENWDMIQIELYEAKDKRNLISRERYWVETLKSSLNKNIPTRTKTEYQKDNKETLALKYKEWRENNRDTLLLKKKEYREKNKDAIALQQKEYRKNNKETVALRDKEKYIKNKDTIALKSKEPYTCECGSTLTISHKLRHERTQKHQKYLSGDISKV
jgi:hypothetical protein